MNIAPKPFENTSSAGSQMDRVRAFYDSAPTESTMLGRSYRRLLAAYFRFLIPEASSVLEIGCSNGDLLSLLPNADIAGIDVSANQIERAVRRMPHATFVTGAVEDVIRNGQLDRKFDYIILSDFL